MRRPPDPEPPAVAWLRSQQCADGSWMPSATTSTPCAFDPATFSGPDTNSTAVAALGLAAVGARAKVDAGTWFAAVRGSDGGWSFSGGADTASDPDSTGLVLAAREALGIAIDQAGFERLVSFQFGPSTAAERRGAFWYPPFDSSPRQPNLLATNDVPCPHPRGLARRRGALRDHLTTCEIEHELWRPAIIGPGCGSRWRGVIGAAGFASGDRVVVGHWARSPIGPDVRRDVGRTLRPAGALRPTTGWPCLRDRVYAFDDVVVGALEVDPT